MGVFDGRVAIVTGAGRGLGADYARFFAADGAAVALADVNTDGVGQVAREISAGGGRAIGLDVDVTSVEATEAMVARVQDELGRIDILVNNAGLWGDLENALVGILDTDPDYWDVVMRVNLKGAFLCTRAAVPVMRDQGYGRIVNMSSIGSRMVGGVYGVSKLALNQLTYAVSGAVGDAGITCNAVAPGPIWNEATQRQVPAAYFDRLIEPLHVKRAGTSADLYSAIRWLSSEDAAWTTGQTIYVDGGFLSLF